MENNLLPSNKVVMFVVKLQTKLNLIQTRVKQNS
jgi:hypothetical protein